MTFHLRGFLSSRQRSEGVLHALRAQPGPYHAEFSDALVSCSIGFPSGGHAARHCRWFLARERHVLEKCATSGEELEFSANHASAGEKNLQSGSSRLRFEGSRLNIFGIATCSAVSWKPVSP